MEPTRNDTVNLSSLLFSDPFAISANLICFRSYFTSRGDGLLTVGQSMKFSGLILGIYFLVQNLLMHTVSHLEPGFLNGTQTDLL